MAKTKSTKRISNTQKRAMKAEWKRAQGSAICQAAYHNEYGLWYGDGFQVTHWYFDGGQKLMTTLFWGKRNPLVFYATDFKLLNLMFLK